MVCDSDGWLTNSASAAGVIPPCSTTARKYRRDRRSIGLNASSCRIYVFARRVPGGQSRGRTCADGGCMTERHVTVETKGRVGVVYLDRPDRRNSYTPIMALQLQEALVTLDADETVAVIVV